MYGYAPYGLEPYGLHTQAADTGGGSLMLMGIRAILFVLLVPLIF